MIEIQINHNYSFWINIADKRIMLILLTLNGHFRLDKIICHKEWNIEY